MNEPSRLRCCTPRPSPWTWMVFACLLAAGWLLLLSAPAIRAGAGPTARLLPDNAVAHAAAAFPRDLAATASLSHTVYLPLMSNGYWNFQLSSYGIQVYALNATAMSRIDDVGAGWIRMPLSWAKVEPVNTAPQNYMWPSSLDQDLADLASHGVRVILTLSGNPSWAATYPGGPIDKVDIGELVEFMQAAVSHYGAPPYNVKYWEFYNEPDNGRDYFATSGSVGYFGYNAQGYVDLLAAVYQPMKDVDPGAKIVFGGLAYDAWDDPWGGPFIKVFLDEVLQKGGGNYFDVMNFHYYYAFASNWQAYGIDIVGKANYIRDKLASYGVSKPTICTETGWPSDSLHDGSDELQSRYVSQVFARSMAADLEIVTWFMLSDEDVLGTHKWGLLTPNLEPKPSYPAYQTLVRQLAGAVYSRTLLADEQTEAYEFIRQWDNVRVILAWTNDESWHDLELAGDRVLMVDKYGAETWVADGADGAADGIVHLPLGPSPVYLHPTR